MVNFYKIIRRLCIRLVRNFKCLSNKKCLVSFLSAFLSLYTFETDYLDPYICSIASSMLASIGIYGTYESLSKILRDGRKIVNSRSQISKEPLYLYKQLSNLNISQFTYFLDMYNKNNQK